MMSAQPEFYNSCASNGSLTPRKRLEVLMNQPSNRYCADCGSPDPKWVDVINWVADLSLCWSKQFSRKNAVCASQSSLSSNVEIFWTLFWTPWLDTINCNFSFGLSCLDN